MELEIEDIPEKKDLDTKWIEEFEVLDDNYKEFYAEDVTYIKFHYIYVNSVNNIEKIKEETVLLRMPNYISREEIIGLLKKNCKLADKSYTVLSILKYNIDIDPTNINYYLKNDIDSNTFLKSITNIDAIPLEKTITMFQDLNNIIFIFYENDKTHNTAAAASNKTKRIYFNRIYGNKRRTYRKTA